jgi:hypothetical protein
LGRRALVALCEAGLPPRVAIGYDPSLAYRSGYTPLGDVAREWGFELIETSDINDASVFERVKAAAPDLLVVAG